MMHCVAKPVSVAKSIIALGLYLLCTKDMAVGITSVKHQDNVYNIRHTISKSEATLSVGVADLHRQSLSTRSITMTNIGRS